MHVVVIGAGFGGLATAAYLSQAGARVTVVERAGAVGGKAAKLEKDGFVFDTGPTLLTMPDVVTATFAAAGDPLRAGDLVRLDPVCRYLFPEPSPESTAASERGGPPGSAHPRSRELVVYSDPARTREEVAKLSPEDGKRWDAFFADCERIYVAAGEPYLEAPFDGFVGFSQRVLKRGPRAVALGMKLGTLSDLAAKHFRSDAMRKFVGRFATYAGGAPGRSSAAFAMIPFIEMAFGAWYPMGGMHALAARLGRALEARGVRILVGTDARGIEVDSAGAVCAVTTSDEGRPRIVCDAVVCDVDPLAVARTLLPPALARSTKLDALESREPSLSGFAWVFGVEGEMPKNAHHTVLFARDYDEEFRAIFDRGTVAEDPSVYVSVASLDDPSRAPKGHHAVFTLVNAPPTGERDDWEALSQTLRERVLARLERDLVPDLRARIRTEAFVTPRTIGRTGSVGGAIYGAAPHGAMAPFERPKNRVDGVRGLYFCGGATHPGGGVPMVMMSGRFVAELLGKDARDKRVRVAAHASAP
jgi:phytoene desaturase